MPRKHHAWERRIPESKHCRACKRKQPIAAISESNKYGDFVYLHCKVCGARLGRLNKARKLRQFRG